MSRPHPEGVQQPTRGSNNLFGVFKPEGSNKATICLSVDSLEGSILFGTFSLERFEKEATAPHSFAAIEAENSEKPPRCGGTGGFLDFSALSGPRRLLPCIAGLPHAENLCFRSHEGLKTPKRQLPQVPVAPLQGSARGGVAFVQPKRVENSAKATPPRCRGVAFLDCSRSEKSTPPHSGCPHAENCFFRSHEVLKTPKRPLPKFRRPPCRKVAFSEFSALNGPRRLLPRRKSKLQLVSYSSIFENQSRQKKF